MCLTLPKKVIEIKENSVIVENHDGARQELKTIVDLAIGDFVISQRGIIIEIMDIEQAKEILNILQEQGGTI
ncbi:MAG: Hydrogenase assembly chaperone hypC/hupF [Candidatus Moranbacteria bacterium GW2011_GWC2_37_73]|nr:MAG: Hydrogenase assembly chaperone hypC/hupF [Parcubacteria group bacterium GW2011_GWC1_36_108]KKQ00457.1 MAG: Hydrogenase assembly chaperone hypC/hupF [Candidatus Moranbacteria bacterium GW2011_GWD1_36_198]KKQ01689.1 MAG: Hydrogenase assembly chaperone hypC/hupF [Candidatus Moranbacteria bacterium GW2011_GWD2_36_198]KKQ39626.1 MAG: Hydrogenase assembly chaperone hypC/hupF [Candidatus Moranbacteria bacterium GW2011_GWC2_37_73]HAR99943.1 HypC/HybG/HupF family hydrogenase formation chaperone 